MWTLLTFNWYGKWGAGHHFAPIEPLQFLYCVAAGLASVVWFEFYKILQR